MSFIFGTNYIVIPLFGIVIFILSYLNSEKIIQFFYDKTLGQREELFLLLDKMYVDTDRRKVSLAIIFASFGIGAIVFLAFWPKVIAGLIFGSLFTFMGWAAPKLVLKNMLETRCNRIVDQMVDGMTIMANGVKSGLSITQSMERVTANMNGPITQEFTLILNQIRLGRSVEEALNEFGDRIPRQDVQMFVTAVNILKETGGNLAETFVTIVTTIRERQKIEKKIDAMTSQATMQATIVTLVPFALLVMFVVVDPTFVMPLFTKPLGWFALLLMIGLQVIGGVMMKKVATIKV
jgi:tight adherence protein B